MARPLSWSDVRGGAIAAVVLALIAFATLKYSRLGTLHGETLQITALVGEARGVLVGSEVWLSGQKVGKIVSIDFRPPQTDTTRRIAIGMQLLAQYRPAIHRDAVAQIQNGGTIIGAPVVYLSPGTSATREIRDGDTVLSKPQVDVEGASGRFGTAARELPFIIANVKQLTAEVKGNSGTAGAFLNSPGGPGSPELARTRAELAQLGARLSGGRGSVDAESRAGVLRQARAVMARVDSVRSLVASPSTSLGRLRRDSTLMTEVGDIRAQLGVVRTMLDESNGTAGRVMHDSALTMQLGNAQREMSALFADIKQHPLRYIRF